MVIEDPSSFKSIFVARQPIFDRGGRIWGFELLFRGALDAQTASFASQDAATAQVIADGFAMATASMAPGRKVLVNFPTALILERAPVALPPALCVVEILEHVQPSPEIVAACRELKGMGYTLALDDYVGQGGVEALIEVADIVKVDVLGMSSGEIESLAAGIRPRGCRLLAEKVEDAMVHDLTKRLGFDYFQGFHFSRPEVVSGRKIPTGVANKIRLLKELANEDFQTEDVADVIGRDPGLSFRLLRYLNSALFSRPAPVTSIAQSVTLLGLRPLRQWLMSVMISDLSESPMTGEMAFLSLQRARFLYALAPLSPRFASPGDTMFMLGLFSKLDAMLGVPMGEVVRQLPLDEAIAKAYLGGKSQASEWLGLLDAIEAGGFAQAEGFLERAGVDAGRAAQEYAKASAWAAAVLGLGSAGPQ